MRGNEKERSGEGEREKEKKEKKLFRIIKAKYADNLKICLFSLLTMVHKT
jgi:hypothetical protein